MEFNKIKNREDTHIKTKHKIKKIKNLILFERKEKSPNLLLPVDLINFTKKQKSIFY